MGEIHFWSLYQSSSTVYQFEGAQLTGTEIVCSTVYQFEGAQLKVQK